MFRPLTSHRVELARARLYYECCKARGKGSVKSRRNRRQETRSYAEMEEEDGKKRKSQPRIYSLCLFQSFFFNIPLSLMPRKTRIQNWINDVIYYSISLRIVWAFFFFLFFLYFFCRWRERLVGTGLVQWMQNISMEKYHSWIIEAVVRDSSVTFFSDRKSRESILPPNEEQQQAGRGKPEAILQWGAPSSPDNYISR